MGTREAGPADASGTPTTVDGWRRRARWLHQGLAARVAVDPRGLAALRIAVGLLVLADLLLRSRDLVVFYTDAGVLPRAVLRTQYGSLASLSFAHGLSGAAWWQGVLFALAGAFALALVLGYRTRLATLGTVLLLVSLHARNPVLLNAGDSLLRRLLLWGLFLPLGGRWSVDALRRDARRSPVADLATAALLLQVVIVYVVNGVIKLRGEAWRSGEAILLVFQLDHLTVRLGDVLAGFPALLEGLGWLWLGLLLTSVLLIGLRGWPRAAFAGLFAAMHVGMFLTMRLGLFPLVSVAALLPFLPPRVWDRVTGLAAPRLRRVDAAPWRERVDRWLPGGSRGSRPPSTGRPIQLGLQGVVAVLLAVVLVWNAASLGYVAAPPGASGSLHPTERRWDMFAPEPRTNDGWFVVPGELASGGTADALHGGPVSWERPPELASTFPSHRWFVYLLELPRPGTGPLRAAFAGYLCRRWNAAQTDALDAVHLYYVLEPATLDGPAAPVRVDLGRYACPG